MKYLSLFSLLVCFALSAQVFGHSQQATPATDTPGVTAEQAAKVKAILATVKLNDEVSPVTAEDALVKEGSAILPVLQAAPVKDNGKPDVPVLVRRQAVVVREAIVRLTWGINPRDAVKQALAARAMDEQRDPAAMFDGYPELITDPQVVRTFPQCLFYVARVFPPGTDPHRYPRVAITTPLLLVLKHAEIMNIASIAPFPLNAFQLTWITTPAELETFFKANAPALPVPVPHAAGSIINTGQTFEPESAEVSAAAYSWVRLYEMVVYGNRLIINPDVKVQAKTPITSTSAFSSQPLSWITGAITATTLPPSGLTGNDLSGALTATLFYNSDSRKLESITTVDKITHVPIA